MIIKDLEFSPTSYIMIYKKQTDHAFYYVMGHLRDSLDIFKKTFRDVSRQIFTQSLINDIVCCIVLYASVCFTWTLCLYAIKDILESVILIYRPILVKRSCESFKRCLFKKIIIMLSRSFTQIVVHK